MNISNFVIFNQRLAGWLMLKGFRLIGIFPEDKNPKMNTFHFPNTVELKREIENYNNYYRGNRIK